MMVVFEGLPGSGKTRSLATVRRLAGVTVIPEIIGQEPAGADESFFVGNDIEKCHAAKGEGLFVLDRNFVSTLCYNRSHDRLYGTSRYHGVATAIDMALQAGLLQHPDTYIYFQCGIQTSAARQRATNDLDWHDSQFLSEASRFYDAYFDSSDIPVTRVSAENPFKEVMHSVLSLISTLSKGEI